MRVLLSTYGSRGGVEPRGRDDEGQKCPPGSSRRSRHLASRKSCMRLHLSHLEQSPAALVSAKIWI